jgi:dihydrofolate reductase
MGDVVVSEFITLDGVFEDPGGAGGFDRGGWAFKFDRGPEGDKFKFDELMDAGALLLGRVTYEGFAKAWPAMQDDSGFAGRMNGLPKYVVSRTLEHGEWNNTTVIGSDVADAVRALKQQVSGDLLVAGSGQLVRTLMEHDLVDEYRLIVYPIILGSGKALFPKLDEPRSFRLTESRQSGDTSIVVYRALRA